MTDERHNLIAFLAVLATIALLFTISAVCLYNGRSVEAIGIGGVMTGLIGVLGTFRPVSKPVQNVENADTVNQGGKA
jgi:hypothetical protein